ncbi:hypothetical protein BDZ88DRAFT_508325 [Geranomyces variabilis]|nr:hypothetical protein BDZ88DRAFT_508325 [Geranomyces variabilis]KAJ3132018.1 hypothetical protein HDU90_007569 [Geranomyces variabilis]
MDDPSDPAPDHFDPMLIDPIAPTDNDESPQLTTTRYITPAQSTAFGWRSIMVTETQTLAEVADAIPHTNAVQLVIAYATPTLRYGICSESWFLMIAALAAVNRLGYEHRDVKKENFVIDATGTVRVIDLGQASKGNAPEAVDFV